MNELAMIALVVRDYDEAIEYFTRVLDFDLVEDTRLSEVKRWVVVAPRGGNGLKLLLAKAANEQQAARVGDQTGGRVFLFLHTDDFARDYEKFASRGVKFIRPPQREAYGMVSVFEDLYGNKWDLIERP
jgi:catechol 2,3-dioxygenase-like lactoylglutathione lyase family enzyme